MYIRTLEHWRRRMIILAICCTLVTVVIMSIVGGKVTPSHLGQSGVAYAPSSHSTVRNRTKATGCTIYSNHASNDKIADSADNTIRPKRIADVVAGVIGVFVVVGVVGVVGVNQGSLSGPMAAWGVNYTTLAQMSRSHFSTDHGRRNI
uniref:Uncharacterized protein n=1 Tax=Strigamia maritima TaxID=126957 RepID=T1J6U2_STRMM